MKARLIAAGARLFSAVAAAQSATPVGDPMLHLSTVQLYATPPGAKGTGIEDIPTLTVFPPFGEPNGTAVIVAPGGAYRGLAGDLEGREVADWFATRGVTVFVLRYRLGEKYPLPIPLMDAQRAVQYVRAHAASYKVEPRKIGFIGFSAGGHLGGVLETETGLVPGGPDDAIAKQSPRPDFVILGYPAFSMFDLAQKGDLSYCPSLHIPAATCTQAYLTRYAPALHITAATPPTFIYHTADDATIPVEDSVNYFLALKRAGVPAELHVFEKGVHGTGLGGRQPSLRLWPALLEQWLIAGGFLPR